MRKHIPLEQRPFILLRDVADIRHKPSRSDAISSWRFNQVKETLEHLAEIAHDIKSHPEVLNMYGCNEKQFMDRIGLTKLDFNGAIACMEQFQIDHKKVRMARVMEEIEGARETTERLESEVSSLKVEYLKLSKLIKEQHFS